MEFYCLDKIGRTENVSEIAFCLVSFVFTFRLHCGVRASFRAAYTFNIIDIQ